MTVIHMKKQIFQSQKFQSRSESWYVLFSGNDCAQASQVCYDTPAFI